MQGSDWQLTGEGGKAVVRLAVVLAGLTDEGPNAAGSRLGKGRRPSAKRLGIPVQLYVV